MLSVTRGGLSQYVKATSQAAGGRFIGAAIDDDHGEEVPSPPQQLTAYTLAKSLPKRGLTAVSGAVGSEYICMRL